ncbi:hypothetical protein [Psychromonas sp. KJ10-2]|uniref:hypothetical protein n=1 Tax=Psychromonas sp. KJ10-2 TaxID=3391822 RepID=UPI0039B4308D
MSNKCIIAIDNGITYDLCNVLNGRYIARDISIPSFNELRQLIPKLKDSLFIAFNDEKMWQGNLLNAHSIKPRGEVYQGNEPIGKQFIWVKRMDSLNTQFEVVCENRKLIDKLTLSQAEWVITHIANSLIELS